MGICFDQNNKIFHLQAGNTSYIMKLFEGQNVIYGGDELMYSGLNVPDLHGDFKSFTWRLKSK